MINFLKNLLWQKEWLGLLFAAVIGLFIGIAEAAESDYQEISGCPECFIYVDSPRIWDGDIQVYSRDPELAQAIERAIEMVNIYADVPLVYMGLTTAPFLDGYSASRQRVALYGFGQPQGGFSAYAYIWWNWHGNGNINYGEVKFDNSVSTGCYNGFALHETLHVLGIGHSDDEHSIMYAGPYHSCGYQATLRLDDIKALQSLYPARPNRSGTITYWDGEELCIYQPEITYDGVTGTELTSCGIPTSIEVILE